MAEISSYTAGENFPQLRKALKEKINNGAYRYMDEKNMAETFLGKMKDTAMEILPQLTESKASKIGQGSVGHERFPSSSIKSLKDILNGFKKGHMSVVGPAGSGKSTLMKTIARNVIEKKYESFSNVEVVVYVKCGDLNTSKFAKPSNLLLSMVQPQLNDSELKEFEEYATAYPFKVLFILDGLDTFPGYFYDATISPKTKQGIGLGERKRVKDILCEMMEGAIFRDCRVITSSRDNAELGQSKKRTVKVVNLSGLTESSIKKITYQYFPSKEAEAFISYLEEQPDLLDLCQTPMFLIFTLIGKKSDPSFSPTIMSEILLFLLDCLLRSKHSTLKEGDLRNLGKLCLSLMKEQRLNFDKTDLLRHHLTVEKVQNLVVDTPGSQYRRMFFVHQSIVEILACFHIINITHQRFSEFTTKYLGEFNPDFSLVEQMLCGILLNESLHEKWGFLQVDALEQKRTALKSHLNQSILRMNSSFSSAHHVNPFHVLNLILSLNEAGESVDAMIKSSLRDIILDGSNLPLSVSEVRAIGSVAARCDRLEVFAINFWLICDKHLDILHACLSKTDTKISKMELQGNHLTADGMMHAGRLMRCCQVQEISFAWSDLAFTTAEPQEALKSLKSSLQEYKLEKLDISFRTGAIKEGDMSVENRTWIVALPYVVDATRELSFPEQLLAKAQPAIVWELSIPGLWREASIDFAHAIGNLMKNVTDRIDVYNWKFTNSEKDILQRKRNETDSMLLEIHLDEDQIITHSNTADCRSVSKLGGVTVQKLVQVTGIREITEVSEHHSVTIPTSEIEPPEVPRQFEIKPLKAHCPENKVAAKSQSSVTEFFTTNEEREFGWIQKFRLSHMEITEDQISTLSHALAKTSFLEEFEFRNCSPNRHLVSKLLVVLRQSQTKISKLSVTASSSVDQFFQEISEIMDVCETSSLNIEETANVENFLQLFLNYLEKRQVCNFKELDLSHIKDIKDFKLLGIISGKVAHLKLVNCDLETEKLEAMCKNVGDSKVQCLDVSYNPELVHEDIILLPKLLCKKGVQRLALRDCCFSVDEMEAFDDPAFDNLKVQELDLSYNGELELDGVEVAGRAVRKLGTKKLFLGSCELDEDCLKSLMLSLQDHNLPFLDLRDNAKIASGCKTVSQLVVQSKTKILNISDCKLDSEQILIFAEALMKSQYKLAELNLSDSQRAMIDKPFVEAIRKVTEVVEEKLIICFPLLEQKCKEMIETSLNQSDHQSIKVIYHQGWQLKEVEFLTLVGTREEKDYVEK